MAIASWPWAASAEIQKLSGAGTKIIDLRGRLAIPGFIEGHGHYLGLGDSKLVLDLTKARSWDDIVAQVGEAARSAKRGSVIEGRGWHQEKWTRPPQPNVEGAPLHASLDAVSPGNPVVLEHASGHAMFVNAAALELAAITGKTANPSGGEIVRDEHGEPTGLLKETAQRLVADAIARLPKPSPAEEEARFRKQVELAGADALSKGITTFHDAGASFATIDGYKKLADEGKLPAPAVCDGALRAGRVAGREARPVPRWWATRTAWSRCARSRSRSTARWEATAHGCSRRTPICRRARAWCSSRWRSSRRPRGSPPATGSR